MPKGADNPSLILDAARELFLEQGYAATSMDAVARAAGVSKATVYACFTSKDELFASMVEREGTPRIAALAAHPDWTAQQVLHAFASDAARLLLSDSVIAMHRLVASEVNRTPSVGNLFFESGPEPLIESLTTFLGDAMDRGELRVAPARLAAAQFLAIIVADLQMRLVMRVPGRTSKATRADVARSGVDVFVRAYAPDRP